VTDARDAYDELGVSPTAEQEVVEAAYLALIKKYHPDHHEGEAAANARAQRLNAAWAEIATAEKRRDYDAKHAPARAEREPQARPASDAPAPGRRRGARVSVARYFGRLRGDGEARRVGPGTIALVLLTLVLLALWMADVRRYWNDPDGPPSTQGH